MEGEEVGIVGVVGPAPAVVVRRPADSKEIVACEDPVDILEGVPADVGMMEKNAPLFPVAQVRRAEQHKRVAHRGGLPLPGEDRRRGAGKRPPHRRLPRGERLGIAADGKLLRATGKWDEPRGRIELSRGAVGAHRHDRRLLGFAGGERTGLDAEDVEDVPGSIGHSVPLEPADEAAVEPSRLAGHWLREAPIRPLEEIASRRRGEHHRAVALPPFRAAGGILDGAPKSPFVLEHRHRRGVPFPLGKQARLRVLRHGPRPATIIATADDERPVVVGRPHQPQGAGVNEEARPERAVDGRDPLPGQAAVATREHCRDGAGPFRTARPEVIVRRDERAVGEFGDRRRPDILPPLRRQMIDDDAGGSSTGRLSPRRHRQHRRHGSQRPQGPHPSPLFPSHHAKLLRTLVSPARQP